WAARHPPRALTPPARHRSPPPRDHARSDDLFLRPLGQPQRGVFRRLHLLPGQPAAHLVSRQDRQGRLLLSTRIERAVHGRRDLTTGTERKIKTGKALAISASDRVGGPVLPGISRQPR